jgi:N6-adenosine-specific RNA methylase IME4
MPVAPLLATRAYVAIWVTHKEPLVRFAMQSLLPAWGATYVATAHWLKVTAHGQPLSPIDPPNPRAGGAPHLPYESIVIGRKGEVSEAHAALEQRLLASRVIIADVGQRHSRKPPLDALFEPLLSALPPKADHHAYLELFARELRSGWTSWGNEVLLFNERDGNFQ